MKRSGWKILGSLTLVLLTGCGKDEGYAPGSASVAGGTVAPPCTTCRIFVTASAYDGNLGGPAGADAKCMVDANKPVGGSAYKALVMASGVRSLTLDWVMKPSRTYFRPDGSTAIATTTVNGDFSTLTNPFGGAALFAHTGFGSPNPWTVSSTNFNCLGYTSNSAANYSNVGYVDNASLSYGVGGGGQPCNDPHRLYCVEQ